MTLTTPDGDKKKVYVYGDSQREAQAAARQLKAETKGRLILGQTVSDLWQRWENEKWPSLAEKTRDYYAWVGKRILAELGSTDARKVTPPMVAAFLRKVHQSGVSGRTVQMHRNTLSALMAFAVEIGWADTNPVREIRTPAPAKPKRRNQLTRAMARLIRIKETRPTWKALWWLMSECALRPTEALLCRAEHIVREKGVWWLEVHGTKTDQAERRVPLPAALVAILPRSGFLFPASTGNALQLRNVQREWKRALETENLPPDCNLYQLRKVAISRWVALGIPDDVVKLWAGHSDIRITKNVYNRVSVSRQIGALRAVSMSNRYEDPLTSR